MMRSLQRLVETDLFDEIFIKASMEEQNKVKAFIEQNNHRGVLEWLSIQQRNNMKLEDMNMRELRTLGGKLGIRDYSNLTKASLLSAIIQKRGIQ